MTSIVDFFLKNYMLFCALLCFLLLLLVCFLPKKKKKTNITDWEKDKKLEYLTEDDVADIIDDDTFIYEQADFKEDNKANELDNLLATMEHDLKEGQQKAKETADDYEDEQEKTAIISYQELLKAARENKIKTSYDDEDNAIIKTSNTIREMVEDEALKEDLSATKKFRNSDFISPIFGKQETVSNYPKVPNFKHDDADEIKIEEEIVNLDSNTDEKFLQDLIAFRDNLK